MNYLPDGIYKIADTKKSDTGVIVTLNNDLMILVKYPEFKGIPASTILDLLNGIIRIKIKDNKVIMDGSGEHEYVLLLTPGDIVEELL